MGIFFRRKYKFTDKKHSKGGLTASGLFLFSLAIMIAGIYISFMKHGNAGMLVGGLGLGSFILALIGFIVGLRSFKEENVFLLFPWIGTAGCAVMLLGMGAVVLIGI
ncbi:MAG: hypothetical protein K2M73_03280 [Lachnospiraceae bacterium]|nr:hypothetical protein [Lachnospiraceae bacterium]MDE6698146.1 hypothetical protein [Lachnospiraceae bacterium]